MSQGEIGIIYILEIWPAYKHARHYTGWSQAPEVRQEAHRNGYGSPLIRAAVAAGCEIILAHERPGTRTEERRLKDLGGASRYCPLCRARAALGRAVAALLLELTQNPPPELGHPGHPIEGRMEGPSEPHQVLEARDALPLGELVEHRRGDP